MSLRTLSKSLCSLASVLGLLLCSIATFSQQTAAVSWPAEKPDTLVFLTFGQSNSACFGQGSYSPVNPAVEFFDGALIVAHEPLKGAGGNGGCSVWTRLADRLVSNGYCKTVVIVAIGIGSTSAESWATGQWAPRLKETLQHLQQHKLKINFIVWHQGESDNLLNTPSALYEKHLDTIRSTIRSYSPHTPIVVCRASYHPEMIGMKPDGIDNAIRDAQNTFIQKHEDVFAGPDTDTYNRTVDRHDGVHFSRTGLDRFANDLLAAISLALR